MSRQTPMVCNRQKHETKREPRPPAVKMTQRQSIAPPDWPVPDSRTSMGHPGTSIFLPNDKHRILLIAKSCTRQGNYWDSYEIPIKYGKSPDYNHSSTGGFLPSTVFQCIPGLPPTSQVRLGPLVAIICLWLEHPFFYPLVIKRSNGRCPI